MAPNRHQWSDPLELPTAPEAEAQVLGSILRDPDFCRPTIEAGRIRPDLFADPLHRAVAEEVNALYREGMAIDPVAVKHRLERRAPPLRCEIPIAAMLAQLGQDVATAANIQTHLRALEDVYQRRALILFSRDVDHAARNGKPAAATLEAAKANLQRLSDQTADADRFRVYDAPKLDAAQFEQNFLVNGVLAEGQPTIIGGPKKSLKTSLLVDLGLSIAAGGKFLGRFQAPRSRRFALLSGESGLATLQETARRVAASKGLSLADVSNFILSPDLPRLDDPVDLARLAAFIERHRIEVVAIDPLYLCLGGVDHANLFSIGPLLREIAAVTQRTGATLIACHHHRKSRGLPGDSFGPPELDDLAWAGFAEWIRQWLLIARRQAFEAGTGEHHLYLNVGGSAGHGALYAVDVHEGRIDDPGGRRWDLSVRTAAEARDDAKAAKREADASRCNADCDLIIGALRSLPDRCGTKTDLRDAAGLHTRRFAPALAALMRSGAVVAVADQVKKANGRTYDGYALAPGTTGNPGSIPAVPADSETDQPSQETHPGFTRDSSGMDTDPGCESTHPGQGPYIGPPVPGGACSAARRSTRERSPPAVKALAG